VRRMLQLDLRNRNAGQNEQVIEKFAHVKGKVMVWPRKII